MNDIERRAVIEEFIDQSYVGDILEMICFQLSPIARVMQKTGEPIPTKAEAEQCAVMRWLLKFAITEGKDWPQKAGEELRKLQEKAEAMILPIEKFKP